MPAVLIMSYPALAQTGSGVGKGGFDRDSIEIFLQGANVRHVIFNEVHKVVDDMRGVSAEVTRVLTEWSRDGSIRGAIGFPGTAAAYRKRFTQLGLNLSTSCQRPSSSPTASSRHSRRSECRSRTRSASSPCANSSTNTRSC